MKKIILTLCLSFIGTGLIDLCSQNLTQSFLFDFGPNDVTNGDITSSTDGNGNYWNNIYLSGIGNINSTNFPAITLKNASGNATTLGFSFVSGSFYLTGKQTANGGLLSPVASNFGTNAELAIATATEDYGFTSLTSGGPVFKFTGLDQTKTYVIKIFASRTGTITRTSQYTLQGGGTTVVGTLNSSTAGTGTNLGNVYVSSAITPTTGGEISVTTISLVASNSAYINCMELLEYNPITTNAVTGVAQNSATGNGVITNIGSSAITSSGVCWSTISGSETVSGSHTTDGPTGSSTPLSIASVMSGLQAGQTYYVKAYAVNSTVTSYGSEVSFTTLAGISTSSLSGVGQNGATCGGTITSAGAYTQRGVCWSTNTNPTISDSKTTDGSGSGSGSFSSSITGLSANQTYHIRAYVTNASGTSYGDDIQFTTPIILEASGNSSNLLLTSVSKVIVPTGIQLTIDNDALVNSLTVNSDGKLTINSGQSLSADSLILQSDINGTATFVNNGTATITTSVVNQRLTSGRNWYLSSPIAVAPYTALSSAGSVQYWDEVNGTWAVKSTGTLTPGMGYISVATSSTGNIQFHGTLNDGDITVNLTRTKDAYKTGFNLIGNPYPSYLNWRSVYNDVVNASANVDPTIWYRTKNAAGTAYKFATYGALSNLGTNVEDDPGVDIVTGNIPPMQAFWVRITPSLDGSSTTGSIVFKNTMRAHKSVQLQGDNNTYNDAILRAPSMKTTTQPVLRLQVSNGINSDEAIVLFNAEASSGLDAYDSFKMSNNSASIPEIYTTVNSTSLAINGLNAIQHDMEIPLGFSTLSSGSFKIRASQISSFESGTKVILKDCGKNIPVYFDLSGGDAYDFVSDIISNDTTRFKLIFSANTMTTNVNSPETSISNISVDNNILSITGFDVDANIEVYNVKGQTILISKITPCKFTLKAGIYIVVVDQRGKKISKQIIIH